MPLFFTDGLSRRAAQTFRDRYPDLSLLFACERIGPHTIALIWHPRYEVVVVTEGLVRHAVTVNTHHEEIHAMALPSWLEGQHRRYLEREAEREDYAVALAVFDRTVRDLRQPSRPAAGGRETADGEAWLRRQLAGLEPKSG